MKRVLVVYRESEPKAVLKLDVLDAEMPHPGWIRFRLESQIPDLEEPTVCWYRVPDGCSVELQHHVEDRDVLDRLGPVVSVKPDPLLGCVQPAP